MSQLVGLRNHAEDASLTAACNLFPVYKEEIGLSTVEREVPESLVWLPAHLVGQDVWPSRVGEPEHTFSFSSAFSQHVLRLNNVVS